MINTLLNHLNYPTILFLMLLESTVIPFPSEVVVAPAAYHAAAGYQNVVLGVCVAALGADRGAMMSCVAAYYLGRPIIYRVARSRWGKMCRLNEEKVERSEQYFDRHGVVATLTGRLIPVIRQLISVPAGLARMNFWKFLLYTTIGAGAWNCILAAMGYYLHSIVPEEQLNDKITEYYDYIKIAVLAIMAVAIAVYLIKKKK